MMHFKRRIVNDIAFTIRHFYKSPKFALLDLFFGAITLFTNPYRTSRKFLQKRGAANIYAYGETPIRTYQRLVEECGIGPEDTWLEMGSGRGKGCFWLAHFIQCKVIGVEWISQFVHISNALKKIFRIKNVKFCNQEIKEVDLRCATVIYLYGVELAQKIPKNVKVICISEPIEGLEVLKKFWVRFPWGRTTAYLQIPKLPPQISSIKAALSTYCD